MIRKRRGSETGDLFPELTPEPKPEPEESDEQRRRRREAEYYSDIQYRDLDYAEFPEPPDDPNVRALRAWATANYPDFSHLVQVKRTSGKFFIRWGISENEGEKRQMTFVFRVSRNRNFPASLSLVKILTALKDERDFSGFQTLVGRPLSLSNLKTKLDKVL